MLGFLWAGLDLRFGFGSGFGNSAVGWYPNRRKNEPSDSAHLKQLGDTLWLQFSALSVFLLTSYRFSKKPF